MKLNRSIGEQDLVWEKRPNQKNLKDESPDQLRKLSINKANSFKNNYSNDLVFGTNTSVKQNIEFAQSLNDSKRPSTNRIDSSAKELIQQKKWKIKLKRKWWNGRGGCTGDLPPPKIRVLMKPSNHLDEHPINIAIRNINGFIHLAFKIKNKDDYDVPAIVNLGKLLGIVYPKTQIMDHSFLRSREFLSFSKEKILRYLYDVINKSNGNIEPDNSKSLTPFHQNRFYVGKGNNYILVRSVIKQRWWWSMNEKEDFFKVNFLWTQWRKNKHLSILETK